MDHAQIAILFLFIGLALIIAEFFIPSGGMIAIMATIALAVSVWAAHSAWWDGSRNIWWSYLATLVLLVPLSIGGAFFLMQKTSLGRHVLLDAPSLDDVTPYIKEEQHLRAMIGKRGRTLSLLNPGGMVKVDGERFHCECPGMLIEAGQDVLVTSIKGNRLVVRPATGPAGEHQALPANHRPASGGLEEAELLPEEGLGVAELSDERDAAPLDFDIPQS